MAAAVAGSKAAPAAKKPAPSASRAVVDWQKVLLDKARMAKKVAANIGGGSRNVLSFKGGRISYQGGTVPGNVLDVVVLSAINENNFYRGKYDPNNPASPVCYAFGSPTGDDEDMAPHDASPDKQSDHCRDCPQNEWGSADTGRGKACKNVVSLAMVTADALDSPEAMAKAEVFYAKLPVTSGKAWKGYVANCGDKHYIQFVTQLGTEPQGETYLVTFDAQREVDGPIMGPLLQKSEREDAKWGDPYPVFEERAPQRRPGPPAKGAPPRPAAKKPKY